MRSDIAHVLVERPRRGGFDYHMNRHHRRYGRTELADLPSHEGMQRPHALTGRQNSLNENLAPLFRFLERSCGRRWDDVYAEICQHIRPTSTVQQHVLGHVRSYVGLDRRGYSQFRIDAGILRKKQKIVYRRVWAEQARADRAELATRERVLAPERELHKIDGIWYWAVFADVPPAYVDPVSGFTRLVCFDAITGATVATGRFRLAKRQVDSRTLRRLGLVNDV